MSNDTSSAFDLRTPPLHVSDAERLGWQRRAAAALPEVLAAGARAGLTPLIWVVSPYGGLIGDVVTRYQLDEALRRDAMRADWQGWVGALRADPWPSSRKPGGAHLAAETTVRGRVRLTLRARLPEPPPDAA